MPPDEPRQPDPGAPLYVTVSLVKQSLGPLTYRVPKALVADVKPGVRVEVPLARARAVGYVIGPAEAPAPDQDHEVRELNDVLDAEPLLTAAQLSLAQFAARYYMSPLAEALRLTHPAGMDMVEHRTVGITEEGRLALGQADGLLAVQGLELDPVERHILQGLQEAPRDAVKLLKRIPGARHRHVVGLVRRGLLRQTALSYEPKASRVTEQLVRLVPGALDETELERLRRKAPRQAAVIDALRRSDDPVPVATLRDADPAVRTRLNPLVRQGFVELETRDKRRDPMAGVPVKPHPAPELNLDQAQAVAVLGAALRKGGFHPFLLHGVTSSGKTEVYLQVIREAVDRGLGAIVLVPEISLTPQLAGRFRARFPEGVAVLHSRLSDGQRQDEWRRVRRGDVRLVVGARSALYAPVDRLGVLVVDEEHDTSFKQEEGLRYNARDLALVRGQQAGALVILGSATPALETYHNALVGRFRLLTLPERATPQPLPQVEIVDLKTFQLDRDGVLTAPLTEALTETLEAGRQVIIFLNRRGFAPFVLCVTCGQPHRCPHCSVSLTLHKRRHLLECHYCGHQVRPLLKCPHCGAENLRNMGLGTERVEEALAARFPGARVGRLDRDTARGARMQQILDATADGKLDILVGTQMVTKGHDFPGVTLVGVINADHALHLPDFRSSERTFQLLSQVAGRAGRRGEPGRVIVQTYNAEHHAIACAQRHDYAGFYAAEMRFRRELGYPPNGHLVAVRVEGADAALVIATAQELGAICRAATREVTVLGPAEAPIARLRGRTRWQLLLKGGVRREVHDAAQAALRYKEESKPADLRVIIDVDPQSML
ncbi:MAG: primosomal protein N' [bacterium]